MSEADRIDVDGMAAYTGRGRASITLWHRTGRLADLGCTGGGRGRSIECDRARFVRWWDQEQRPREELAARILAAGSPDDELSIPDIAGLTGLDPATLRDYFSKGMLPDDFVQVGKRRRWYRRSVAEWVRNRPGKGFGGGRPRKATAAPRA